MEGENTRLIRKDRVSKIVSLQDLPPLTETEMKFNTGLSRLVKFMTVCQEESREAPYDDSNYLQMQTIDIPPKIKGLNQLLQEMQSQGIPIPRFDGSHFEITKQNGESFMFSLALEHAVFDDDVRQLVLYTTPHRIARPV